MATVLVFDMVGAYYADDNRHPQQAIRELGITYFHAVPQSMFDSWEFWLPENMPDEMPSYLKVQDRDPEKFIGWGLSKEWAEKIKARSQ